MKLQMGRKIKITEVEPSFKEFLRAYEGTGQATFGVTFTEHERFIHHAKEIFPYALCSS